MVNSWLNAANGGSSRNIINVTKGGSSSQIKFVFEDMEYGGNIDYGIWAPPYTVKINSNPEIPWTLNTYEVPERVDLKSLLLHELGHVFLSGGHSNDQSSALRTFDNFSVKRSVGWCTENVTHDYYDPPKNVTVYNSFSDSGVMKVDGTQYSISSSGKTFYWRNSNFPHTLEAVNNQSVDGYVWVFREWVLPNSNSSSNPITISTPSSKYSNITAEFDPTYTINFKNSFPGVGNAGTIKVNGSSYNVTTPDFSIISSNTITAEAPYQEYNGIYYTFSSWSGGGSNPATFSPNANTTYTAYYSGSIQPLTITSYSGPAGTPVVIAWVPNPNSNVVYKVYRKIKDQSGTWSGPDLLTTLQNTTSSYTDNNVTYTNGYTEDLIQYDIRPYYSVENVSAQESWVTVYGNGGFVPKRAVNGSGILPTENSLGNYPNPFNPETRITFSLKERSHVALSLYSVTGQLVSQMKEARLDCGTYETLWQGKSDEGQTMASGIYIARLVIVPISSGQTDVRSIRLSLIK